MQNVPVVPAVSSAPMMPREVAARYRGWVHLGCRPHDPALQYYSAFDDRLGGRQVFIKLYPRGSDDDRHRHAQLISRMLIQCKHPHIAPLHESIATPKYYLSISPALTGGTLTDMLRHRSYAYDDEEDSTLPAANGGSSSTTTTTAGAAPTPLTEHDVIRVIRSVLQALQHLHAEGIRFGSLHPSKIVYGDASADIADLMLSGFRGSYSVLGGHNPALPRKRQDLSTLGLHYGAVPFLAPEEVVDILGDTDVLHYRHTPYGANGDASEASSPAASKVSDIDVGQEADMWGVGVLSYLLLTGQYPFWGRGESAFHVAQKILTCEFSPDAVRRNVDPFIWPPAHLTKEAIAACPTSAERMFREVQLARGSMYAPALDFIRLCLLRHPSERMTASEALLHPWLTRVNPLEGPSERVIPKAARQVFQYAPLVSTSWAQPAPLGRFKEWLHEYVGCCGVARVRLNTFTLAALCRPGPWRDREQLVVDLTQSGSGAVSCSSVIQSLMGVLRRQESRPTAPVRGTQSGAGSSLTAPVVLAPPRLQLTKVILRRCDLHDAAVAFIVQLLMDNIALVGPTLEEIDLRDNLQLTHDSGRSILRLVAAWQRWNIARQQSGSANFAAKVSLRVAVDGTNIGAHLAKRIQDATGAFPIQLQN